MQGRFSGKKSVNFSSLLEKSVFLPLGKSDRNEEKQAFRVPFLFPHFLWASKENGVALWAKPKHQCKAQPQ
ncbi:hypothetical protein QV03_05730 [Gallibacterium anatis]|uniref:Uncharacterized protein n=1 Tax=Gallibacterium anatis TaxID=750 RepID=A0A1A7P9J8_9PAST|nr:hypothetical protein QV03_05730 [Gallibacterium anatis]